MSLFPRVVRTKKILGKIKPRKKQAQNQTKNYATMQDQQKIINKKMRVLQRLARGGTKICRGKAAMLEEAINYIKLLQDRVQLLEQERDGVAVKSS